jgi:hypothetical protein
MFDFNSKCLRIDSGCVELIIDIFDFSKLDLILPPELIILETRNRSF